MAAVASEAERAVLEEEFKWLLREEVHAVLKQLKDVLKEASRRFTLSATGPEGQTRQENFKLGSSATDQVKGVLTLQGDALTQAIQDARNHVGQALYLLNSRDQTYQFKSGAEVTKLMDAVMLQLTRARNRLTTPAAMTLPEVASSSLMKMFTPPLPGDVFANFYINLSKLCLIVYQLHLLQPNLNKNFKPAGSSVLHNPGSMFEMNNQKFEVSHVHKVECVVPWLNDTLVFFTIALQLCQQLKDKISVFSSYWNFKPY
ncbi:protein rogdi homolog isoform X2 [Chiloscyllium plagiosum]|uniref:protein rogdi homolog isoform X2 n=1 Tax=Chiloscyllium plagiosum TaxID=36176 RepID=UPI001CB827C9|nr:protein rogdi homolog isoform X2 [Chiloscyllium plagiosum]